jgi:hypothetical protein
LCAFLDGHPRYGPRFRQLSRWTDGRRFTDAFVAAYKDDAHDLDTEWSLFIVNLQYGYDIPRAAIEFAAGEPLPSQGLHRCRIRADRGWQSARCQLQAGQDYTVTATGRFSVAQVPKPWVSEADGLSIRFVDGKPIGQLLACLREVEGPTDGRQSMLRVLPVGHERSFTSPLAGTLYLRLNDSWSELADNLGEIEVTIRAE